MFLLDYQSRMINLDRFLSRSHQVHMVVDERRCFTSPEQIKTVSAHIELVS